MRTKAIDAAVKLFRDFIDVRDFTIAMYHEPLADAFAQRLDKDSLLVTRKSNFIRQFTMQIEHIKCLENIVVDAMSHLIC